MPTVRKNNNVVASYYLKKYSSPTKRSRGSHASTRENDIIIDTKEAVLPNFIFMFMQL